MVYIGIDPDSDRSGVVILKDGKLEKKMLGLFELEKYLLTFRDTVSKYLVVIEKGELNKRLFNAVKMPKRVGLKVAAGIGKNFMITDLLIDFCEIFKITYETYTPRTKKLDSKEMKLLTGMEKSNQEIRDAFRCVQKYYRGEV